jgi:hypothetical protein
VNIFQISGKVDNNVNGLIGHQPEEEGNQCDKGRIYDEFEEECE